jgi:hypothetical protein
MTLSPCRARAWALVLTAASILLQGLAPARAQDAHYWTQQYGSRESLLGGAVIGSVDGLPSVYYNPARLGAGDAGSFALSTHVLGWETLTVEDGVRPGVDLSSSRTGLEPSLIAGRLPWGGENGSWAYSLLTRRSVDSDVGTTAVADDLVSGGLRAAASLRLENRVRDYWGGITWSSKLSSGFAIGVSGFVAHASADRRSEVIVEGLDSAGDGVIIVDAGGYEFSHFRALAKLGASYGIGSLDLGATLTTPSVGIWGSGDIGRNVGVAGAGSADRLDVAVRQGLDTEYRSPLSAGLGAAWSLGATRVHASFEWFDGIDSYRVAESAPIGAPDELVDLEVIHAAGEVFNWGVGIEHRFTDGFEGFGSFITDKSSASGDESAVGTARWSMDVVTAGARVDTPWMKVTLGLGLAYGNTPLDEIADLTEIDDGPTDVAGASTTLRYRNWRVIFGFEF